VYRATELSKVEARCDQILTSPYLRKEAPAELKQLRAVLQIVEHLVREDVPQLVSEVKHLRSQNKKLEAELELLREGRHTPSDPIHPEREAAGDNAADDKSGAEAEEPAQAG
jgi:cell division protein FtsB